jgi:hypothetical protein
MIFSSLNSETIQFSYKISGQNLSRE